MGAEAHGPGEPRGPGSEGHCLNTKGLQGGHLDLKFVIETLVGSGRKAQLSKVL